MNYLEKYFEGKSFKDILALMILSIEQPFTELDFNTYGTVVEEKISTGFENKTVKTKSKILGFIPTTKTTIEKVETFETKITCFGCVATNMIIHIMEAEKVKYDLVEFVNCRFLVGNNPKIEEFEIAINSLRLGDMEGYIKHLPKSLSHLIPTEERLFSDIFFYRCSNGNYKEAVEGWKNILKNLS
jgi:hypothetical protein